VATLAVLREGKGSRVLNLDEARRGFGGTRRKKKAGQGSRLAHSVPWKKKGRKGKGGTVLGPTIAA